MPPSYTPLQRAWCSILSIVLYTRWSIYGTDTDNIGGVVISCLTLFETSMFLVIVSG